jgi:PAS domain-containing protein
MNDQRKSKLQLIDELSALRQQLSELQLAQESSSALASPNFRHQEDEFKTLVENSPDAIIRLNQSLEILFANSRAITVLGIPAKNYVGKTPTELFRLKSSLPTKSLLCLKVNLPIIRVSIFITTLY